MAKGRKRLADEPVMVNVSLPSSLVAEVRLLLLDPLTGRVGYGKQAELVSHLLADWVKKQKEARANGTLTDPGEPQIAEGDSNERRI